LHIRPLFIPLVPFFLHVTLRYEWAGARDAHKKRKQDIEVKGENELRGEKKKKIKQERARRRQCGKGGKGGGGD